MSRKNDPLEYSLPGEEFTRPPEVSETLKGQSRYPGGFGARAQAQTAADPVQPTLAEPARAEETAGRAATSQSRRKRTLLLQFAAVASSVVLVANSFGLDLLGLDGLFNDSVLFGHVEEEHYEPEGEYVLPGLPVGGDRELPEPDDAEPALLDYEEHPHDRFIAAGSYFGESRNESFQTEFFLYLDEHSEDEPAGPVPMDYRDEPRSSVISDADSFYYDEGSNTLYLRDYSGGALLIHRMGADFTIHLEGENELHLMLYVSGGSLRLTGDGSLKVNEGEECAYGVLLDGAYSDACLMIDENVTFSFRGTECAVKAQRTRTEKMIWITGPGSFTRVRQTTSLTEDAKPASAIDPSDEGRYYSWWLIERSGENLVTEIGRSFSTEVTDPTEPVPAETTAETPRPTDPDETQVPATEEPTEEPTEPPTEPEPILAGEAIGGDAGFPVLPNPNPLYEMQEDGTPYTGSIGVLNDSFAEIYWLPSEDEWRTDVVYDSETNTLTLTDCTISYLFIGDMGTSLTIRLVGRNEVLHNIKVYNSRFEAGCALTFAGDGCLVVNAECAEEVGIYIDGEFSQSCLMIGADVTLDVYGSEAAVDVSNTSSAKAIYYLGGEVSGVRQEVYAQRQSSDASVEGFFYDWQTIDPEGNPSGHLHVGGELLPEPEYPGLPFGGDSEYPVLPNLSPNSPIPAFIFGADEDVILNEDYIQLFDRTTDTWEFLYVNSAWQDELVSPQGISYDPATNTLTLNNYIGGGISVNMMGNGLTVELIGMNILTQDFMVWGFYTGGSIRFTGTGSLSINSTLATSYGLELICENSLSCLMIDPGVTLDIYGEEGAVIAESTSAEKGFYYLSEAPMRTVRQVALEESEFDDGKLYRIWVLTYNDGVTFVKHLHIEGQ